MIRLHLFLGLLLVLPSLPPASSAQTPQRLVTEVPPNNPFEPSIAIDPTDPTRLVAAAFPHFLWLSSDAGSTWKNMLIESEDGVRGDPVVAFGADGTLYVTFLTKQSQVAVRRSTNFGLDWAIQYIPRHGTNWMDKPWIATSKNQILLVWTELARNSIGEQDTSRIYFSTSRNGGENWTDPIVISDSAFSARAGLRQNGAMITSGPSGQIYVTWATPDGYAFDRSFDEGKTFGRDVRIIGYAGAFQLSIPDVATCYRYPSIDCDRSKGENAGRLFVTWADQHADSIARVYLARSDDSGLSWRTNELPGEANNHRFLPQLAVDDRTGALFVSTYDRSAFFPHGPDSSLTEVTMFASQDGGESFTQGAVTDRPTRMRNHVYGEYMGIAASNGYVYANWDQAEGNEQEIWTAGWRYAQLKNKNSKENASFAVIGLLHSPSGYRCCISTPVQEQVTIRATDVLGRSVQILHESVVLPGEHCIQINPSPAFEHFQMLLLTIETQRGARFFRKAVIVE